MIQVTEEKKKKNLPWQKSLKNFIGGKKERKERDLEEIQTFTCFTRERKNKKQLDVKKYDRTVKIARLTW